MNARVRTTWCEVRIITPQIGAQASEEFSFRTGRRGALRRVTTRSNTESWSGSFSLEFTPEGIGTAEAIAARVPPYSLVTIRAGSSEGEGDDPTLMVGLTSPADSAETFGPSPQRGMTISGRGIECVLEDSKVWHAPYLEGQSIDAFLDRSLRPAYLDDLTGTLTWARGLWGGAIDPREAMLRILLYYLGHRASGVVSLLLPQGYQLRQLLVPGTLDSLPGGIDAFAPALEFLGDIVPQVRVLATLTSAPQIPPTWTMLRPDFKILTSQLSPQPGDIVNMLRQVHDATFHELFVRHEDGAARILHRTRPFLRANPTVGASAFAPGVADLPTVHVSPDDLRAVQMRHGVEPVYNVFYVTPAAGTTFNWESFKALVAPSFCGRADEPAFVGRYGVRPLDVSSPYITADNESDPNDTPEIIEMAKELAETLRSWYAPHPLMRQGRMMVRGRSTMRPGVRVVRDPIGSRPPEEFYATGAGHTYDLHTGEWTATLDLTRGWNLRSQEIMP